MNMIIAIMSEKFAEVGANAELYKFQQQISIINDFLWVVDLKARFQKDKYILVIKPNTGDGSHYELRPLNNIGGIKSST